MARHLIMGYYMCNLGHSHSSDNEMVQCNRMEEEKHKREHDLIKENHENQKIEKSAELQRLALEHQKLDLEKQRLDHERDKMKHEERMAELEVEKLKQNNKEKPQKSRVCVLS